MTQSLLTLQGLTYAGAAVLVVLVLLFIGRISGVDNIFSVREWRTRGRKKAQMGFTDMLLYDSVIDDGLIIGKNGMLMTTWKYVAQDSESATDEQKTMMYIWANDALRTLGNGYMLHIDCVREGVENYSNPLHSHFPDRVSKNIDLERRKFFGTRGAYYESAFYLTLTYFPPILMQKKFVDLLVDDERGKKTGKMQEMEIIDGFKQAADNFQSLMSSAFKMERLGMRVETQEDGSPAVYDDYLSYLHFCITGKHFPIRQPLTASLSIDSLVGGVEFHHGLICKADDKFLMAVELGGLPQEGFAGMLNTLAEQPLEYRWNTRFIYMDEHEALKSLGKLRSKWHQKVRGFFSQIFNLQTTNINQDAAAMVAEAEEFTADASNNLVASGIYNSCVILMHEDRAVLEECASALHRQISRLGFMARIEKANTMQAYLGSLPGDGIRNVRRNMIHSLQLSSLLPQSSIWTGEEKAPCPMYPPLSPCLMHCVTSSNTPFRLNLHVRDLGHTLVFGPTGAGKSVLLATLAAQFRRYEDMSVFCFDKGMSMYALCKAVGGLHFNVAADDGGLSFAPLSVLDGESDVQWAAQWIEVMLSLNGHEITAQQRIQVVDALYGMRKLSPELRTLTQFIAQVQDTTIRDVLHDYTIKGSLGHLLDATSDNLSMSRFTVFEIEELMAGAGGQGGNRVALPVLLYLFRRIERSLRGQPAVIILDEAWLMLGHDAFRGKIVEWLKVLRKANCSVILATQSLSDAANSGILDVLVESSATKIFLPNIYAQDEMSSELYRRMGLNSRQIEIIAGEARPKRHYYYTSERGRRLFELALGKFAISFVGVSDKESVAEIKKLEGIYGEKWVDEWLKIRGVEWPDGKAV